MMAQLAERMGGNDQSITGTVGEDGGEEGGREEGFMGEEENQIEVHEMEEHGEGEEEDAFGEEGEEEIPLSPPVQTKPPTEEERITHDIRYNLMDELNSFREDNGLHKFWEDLYMIKPAQEFARDINSDTRKKLVIDQRNLESYIQADFGTDKKYDHLWVRYIFEDDTTRDLSGLVRTNKMHLSIFSMALTLVGGRC